MLRYFFPLAIGVGGAAVLVSLGIWQLQRLDWKQTVLAEIAAEITAAPVQIPRHVSEQDNKYLPVRARGATDLPELHVLVSQKATGAGFRIITALETEQGRRILLDQGFVPSAAKEVARPGHSGTFTGNLHWPDERDGFTPANDPEGNYWFARDIEEMAQALGTEPILMVLSQAEPPVPGVAPLPVTIEGIPNNHLGYAVQWFGLAAVWLGMTGFFLWRRDQTTG